MSRLNSGSSTWNTCRVETIAKCLVTKENDKAFTHMAFSRYRSFSTSVDDKHSELHVILVDYLEHPDVLLDAIAANRTIETVEFGRLRLQHESNSDELCKVLIQRVLELPTLTVLNFDFSHYNIECPQVLWSAFRRSANSTITDLRFIRCKLRSLAQVTNKSSNDSYLQDFFNAIIHNFIALKNLDLSSNDLGTDECEMLSKALCMNEGSSTLEVLNLDWNKLNDDSCLVLSNILCNSKISLKALHLSFNNITDVGLQVLVTEGLCHNETLTKLNIGLNKITAKWSDGILYALKNDMVMTLESIVGIPHYATESMKNVFHEIQFYLKLNRAGRRHFVSNKNEKNNVSSSKEQWMASLLEIKDDIQCLYYFIVNRPEHCSINYPSSSCEEKSKRRKIRHESN